MTDVSFAKKLNRRIRIVAQPYTARLFKKFRTIWAVKPYTMIEYPRLASAYDLMFESEKYNTVEGAIVECGSWSGGYAALMNSVSESCGKKRDIWLFDSFEGLPKPGAEDVTLHGKSGKLGAAKTQIELVEKVFSKVEQHRVHIVAGWFQDTFPHTLSNIGPIAYAHIDCDFYEATLYSLEQLYPLLSSKALVIIDDYSYYMGCKKAVDEFLNKHNLMGTLVEAVDHTAYFRKP